jgi:Bacterial regulatory protein, Fis family
MPRPRLRSTESLLAHIGQLIDAHVRAGLSHAREPAFEAGSGLKQAVARFERAFIERVIAEHGGNRREAAASLRIGYSTLKHKLNGQHAAPQRGGANKGQRADMKCRIAGCTRRSRGPRFGWMCDRHEALPEAVKRQARARWNDRHRTFA